MKFKSILARIILALAIALPHVARADAASELKTLVERITAKIRAGSRSAEDLAPDLAAFAALRAKYRGEKTSAVAQMWVMEAALHIQVIGDLEKARPLLVELKKEFAGLPEAQQADEALTSLDRAVETQKARDALLGKPAPALTFHWSTREGLTSLADLKGKVVVLDFWATWCGPCISSFPQVRELTAHYEGLDVIVLGVTSIQGVVANLEPARIDTKGDPKRELALMHDFIKAKTITWPVVFSDQPVFNQDYGVNGIPHMAIVAPDGTLRHNGMHPASPHAEKVAKIDALLKEFGKPTKG